MVRGIWYITFELKTPYLSQKYNKDIFHYTELNTYFKSLCKSWKSYEINSNGLRTVSFHPRKGSNWLREAQTILFIALFQYKFWVRMLPMPLEFLLVENPQVFFFSICRLEPFRAVQFYCGIFLTLSTYLGILLHYLEARVV